MNDECANFCPASKFHISPGYVEHVYVDGYEMRNVRPVVQTMKGKCRGASLIRRERAQMWLHRHPLTSSNHERGERRRRRTHALPHTRARVFARTHFPWTIFTRRGRGILESRQQPRRSDSTLG